MDMSLGEAGDVLQSMGKESNMTEQQIAFYLII